MMIKKLRAFGFAVALIFFAATFSLGSAGNQVVVLGLGASSGRLLERPYQTVLIGDPNIVDVLRRSDRWVIFQSLNLGRTNVIFVDERSIVIANFDILVCETTRSPIADRDEPDCGQVNAAKRPPT